MWRPEQRRTLLDGEVQDAAWSPDEPKIAFVRDGQVWRAGRGEREDDAISRQLHPSRCTSRNVYAGRLHLVVAGRERNRVFGRLRPVGHGLLPVKPTERNSAGSVTGRRRRAFPRSRRTAAYLAFVSSATLPSSEVVDVATRTDHERRVASTAAQVTWAGDGLLRRHASGDLTGAARWLEPRLLVEGTGGLRRAAHRLDGQRSGLLELLHAHGAVTSVSGHRERRRGRGWRGRGRSPCSGPGARSWAGRT